MAISPLGSLVPRAHARSDLQLPTEFPPPGREVTLVFQVLDKKAAPVTDLQESEVKIFEDGTEQKISTFGFDHSAPVMLGILVDMSGSQRDSVKALKKELTAVSDFVAAGLHSQDSAYVAVFSEQLSLIVPVTRKTADLTEGLQKIAESRPAGPTKLYDSIVTAANARSSRESGRKVLLVLSDFQDNSSSHSSDETVRQVQTTSTEMFCLVDEMSASSQLPKSSLRSASESAKELCDKTGGQALPFYSMDSLKSALTRVQNALHDFYVVTYQTTNEQQQKKRPKLKIALTRNGLKAVLRPAFSAAGN